ncbi:CHAD domain-containing protein [Streptomyces pseudogriseolus]|uniref:CHAD domain-containing protein n=2 Tax=Streptomyces pseudogriseolus TaxID=36817 RepID=UPI001CE24E9D|nr:CHAD domain-containing protein [Streptomyces pseudogriseolus]
MAQQHHDPADVLARHLRERATEFLRALRLHRGAATPEESAEAARALRRAARRISAGLYTFQPLLDPAWSQTLGPELAWVSGTLSQEDACATRLTRLLEALHRLSGPATPTPPAARSPRRTAASDAGPRGTSRAPGGPAASPGGEPPHPAEYGQETPEPAHAPAAPDTARCAAASAAQPVPDGRGTSAGAGPRGAARLTGEAAASPDGRPSTSAEGSPGTPVPARTPGVPATRHAPVAPAPAADAPSAPAPAAARRAATVTATVPAPDDRRAAGRPRVGGEPGSAGRLRAEDDARTAAGEARPRAAGAQRDGSGGGRAPLTVGAAKAGALLERQLTLARTRAHSSALQALGSARFHAVADQVAVLASEVPLAAAAEGADLRPLADAARERLADAVAALPLLTAGSPYNAEALVHGLSPDPAPHPQDAPWHQVRLLLRLHRYAQEVLHPDTGDDPRLRAAGEALDRHRDAAEAAAAAAHAARTPRIAPATAYALGVLHADQRHEVEAARYAFQRAWQKPPAGTP